MSIPSFSAGGISAADSAGTPPLSNGGVIERAAQDDFGIGGPCRIDKYHASVYAPIMEVLSVLETEWGPGVEWSDTPYRAGGYQWQRKGVRWETELSVKFGGKQPWANVASHVGVCGPKLAELLRSRWEHRVTRVDAKIDVQGEHAFDHVLGIVNHIRREQRIVPKMEEVRDVDGIDGRTVYIGSKESEFRVCIYDKTLQMQHVKGIVVPPNIIRVEGRYKPQTKQAGVAASKLKPVDYFGVSGWGRELYERLAGEAIEAVPVARNGTGTLDQSMLAMVAQYLKPIRLAVEREGGWDKFGEYLSYLEDEAEQLVKTRMDRVRQRNEAARQ